MPTQLETHTQVFIDALAQGGGPPIYTLSPAAARNVLRGAQSGPVAAPAVDIDDRTVGNVSVRIVRPTSVTGPLPAIIYHHGGGWVMGDRDTHARLVAELAVGVGAAVVFVNFTPSPEAKFPVAIEEAYTVARWVAEQGDTANLDPRRIAVAGDSVGGNMTIAVTLLAKQRGGPKFQFQLLFYPVTDGNFDNGSYRQFAAGPWLTKPAMEWFWNQYLPDTNARTQPLACPLHASIDDLRDLPPALVITAANDVLRDEGEAYAEKLMQAGVSVTATRYLGTIHDFVLLNAIAATPAPRAAIAQAIAMLRSALGT